MRSSGPIQEGTVALSLEPGPPAGEGGIWYLCRRAEAAGAQSRPPAAALLEGGDALNSCGHRPGCANLVHVGPPVASSLSLSTLQPGPTSFHPLPVSHVLKHYII